MWNAVYETPCGGRVTMQLRLTEDLETGLLVPSARTTGTHECPIENTDEWRDMGDTLGLFISEDHFECAMRERRGWSIIVAQDQDSKGAQR